MAIFRTVLDKTDENYVKRILIPTTKWEKSILEDPIIRNKKNEMNNLYYPIRDMDMLLLTASTLIYNGGTPKFEDDHIIGFYDNDDNAWPVGYPDDFTILATAAASEKKSGKLKRLGNLAKRYGYEIRYRDILRFYQMIIKK